MLILDLGKARSLACWYESDDTTQQFRTVPTRPADFHTLLSERVVDRVVIEVCDAAGGSSQEMGYNVGYKFRANCPKRCQRAHSDVVKAELPGAARTITS